MSESDLSQAYAIAGEQVREAELDVWLATLFAPATARPHLLALHAFAHEIARAPDIVSQPALGEIRLQWWREVLEGERRGEATANPIAAALLDTASRFHLPTPALTALIEARRFDFYQDSMPSMTDLEGYLGETWSVLFRLGSIIAAGGSDPGGADAAGRAGVAYGLMRLLQDLPRHAARGQCYVPKDVLARHGALPEAAAAGLASPALDRALDELRGLARQRLAEARAGIASLDPAVRAVFLPLALVEPGLRALDKARDPFTPAPALSQWRRQWVLWRASRRW